MDDIYDLFGYYYGFDSDDFSPVVEYGENLSRLYLYFQFDSLELQEWCFELDWV